MPESVERIPSEPSSARVVPLLALAIGLAVILRCLYLSSKSLWLDEISSMTYVALPWKNFWHLLWEREGNMVLYYLLLRGWLIFGHSQAWAKLLSVLFGVATVPAMYVFGRDFFNRRVGLFAAFVLAISACHVRSSQWIRSYSLLLLFLTLSGWFLAKALENSRGKDWVWWVITAGLAVYCHVYAVLVIAAQVLAVLFFGPARQQANRFILALLGLAIFISPAAYFILARNVGQLDWLLPPKPLELYHWAVFLAAAGGKVVGNLLLVLCVAALVCGALSEEANWKTRLLWMWLLFPPLAAFAFSYVKPIFFYRYLIISLPAFVLLVANGISRWRPSYLRTAVFGIGLVLAGFAVSKAYLPEEDWESAMKYLFANDQPGDAVIFPGAGSTPFAYYKERLYLGERANFLQVLVTPPASTLDQNFAAQHRRVWLVMFPNFITDEESSSIQEALARAYAIRDERHFKLIKVRLYERNP